MWRRDTVDDDDGWGPWEWIILGLAIYGLISVFEDAFRILVELMS